MKILGLDLGVGSVGWALIETDSQYNPEKILGMGSRVVNLSPDESKGFEKGNAESVCAQRTLKRTMRKGMDRYQLRREHLRRTLDALGMNASDTSLNTLPPLALWHLRSRAASEKISLRELGRVLMHINQKRGYKHAKSDIGDSKQTAYVEQVNANHRMIAEKHLTIGQHFYKQLLDSAKDNGKNLPDFRIKDIVFPRKAYAEEIETILRTQQKFYPEVLTDQAVKEITEIILFQRPLKSCKHLVSRCELEASRPLQEGEENNYPPKVAPRTAPLSQVTRIWEAVNNIKLVNPKNRNHKPMAFNPEGAGNSLPKEERLRQEEYILNDEERQIVFDWLNTNDKMTATKLFELLGLKKSDGFRCDDLVGKGLKGNSTYVALKKALEPRPDLYKWLQFDVHIEEKVNPQTGEIYPVVSTDFMEQPMYRLWHIIYSSKDKEELTKALARIGIDDTEIIENLYAIDFVKDGYANKSTRAMRRILPYLMQGMMYRQAAERAGYVFPDQTIEGKMNRELSDTIGSLKKNSMRQPIVEKVLNQMINVVNDLIGRYGPIDEARVELARQLRQTKDQRSKTFDNINKREKENEKFKSLIAELRILPTRNRIQKYRLWEETGHTCIYCGQPVNALEFLEGNGAEIEHIIPRSVFFDDSLQNKACACRKCNQDKNNRTGYDFMASKGEDELNKYVSRVEDLHTRKVISRTKRDRLLTPGDKIPEDFLNRDLTLSQYIARKAVELLSESIRTVNTSSGSVTDFLRHTWGYDEILHNLNLKRYEAADLVHEVEFDHKGGKHKERRIDDWTKRLDHRHHAIDALTIALTRQAYIHRLNSLNSERDMMFDEIEQTGYKFKKGHELLKQWTSSRPHFTVDEVTEAVKAIAVSFKAGKKLATPGKRYIYRKGRRILVQKGLIVPRGALHQESVYGRILVPSEPIPLKKAFEKPEKIVNPVIRNLVADYIAQYDGNTSKALKMLKKNPIIYPGSDEPIEKVKIYEEKFVLRYKVDSLKPADVDSIADKAVREAVRQRFEECGNNVKDFQKSLIDNPIYPEGSQFPVKNVRRITKLNADSVVGIHKDANGKEIGFAKTGNNNHVAFYKTEEGKIVSTVVTALTALRRKMIGLPFIIKDPKEAWQHIAQLPESDELKEVAKTLPDISLQYIMDMRIGEMFILGMSEDEFNDAIATKDKAALCAHLFRVQKMSTGDYYLRFHTETRVDTAEKTAIAMKAMYRVSDKSLMALNPRKVKVSPAGEIIL